MSIHWHFSQTAGFERCVSHYHRFLCLLRLSPLLPLSHPTVTSLQFYKSFTVTGAPGRNKPVLMFKTKLNICSSNQVGFITFTSIVEAIPVLFFLLLLLFPVDGSRLRLHLLTIFWYTGLGGRGKQRLTDSLNSSGTCLLVHVSALLNTAPSGTEGLWWWGRCWCSIFMITFSLMRWLMWLIYWLINLDPDQFLWMAVCSPPECVFYVYSFLFFPLLYSFPAAVWTDCKDCVSFRSFICPDSMV